ncbi:aldehyde dehydrogenase domain-containing protein [Flagelloscypha sp. PMI_526]|nr:aldehyde dehydrogenase domain-containing protein [Flagelloscypha sp. PMI_526]
MAQFTFKWDTAVYKGETSINTGIFIDDEWSPGSDNTTIDIINPSSGKVLTAIAEGTPNDVDRAVQAAQKAFDTVWGLNAPGSLRRDLLTKLADLMQRDFDELCAIEALDNVKPHCYPALSFCLTSISGKTYWWAGAVDVPFSIQTLRYYAGWADKLQGKVIETSEAKLGYTRHEPIGVVGQIIPWNFPLIMLIWKWAPALATGNTIVMKPSELTPLSALKMCHLVKEAGFPPGVVNVVTGYGTTVGHAISSHMDIRKVAFTGSTLVGRKIMEAAAKSNLKPVTLELGGKSPLIIFDDADLDEALKWVAHGLFWNAGQTCSATTRIFVQETIHDKFIDLLAKAASSVKVGDPFAEGINQGPLVSQTQYERVMGYIESGKSEGAKVAVGGERQGTEGYYIPPTLFTNVSSDMKIAKEEIFGPVGVIIPFKDEEDAIKPANDTIYGLAAGVFSTNINRALNTAHKLKAGTAWVNCSNTVDAQLPFGGFKQSGIGREQGEYALANYTVVKAVHVNLGIQM